MNASQLLAHFDRISDAPYAVPRLRRFILDLAVRGKLVPQHADEEPAAALLERIATEKARLARAGRARTGTPPPSIAEHEVPFPIPPTWRWVRLGAITSYIQRGKSPKYAASEGMPVISQKCVQWAGLDLSVAKLITRESHADYEAFRFIGEDDLLWNSTGTGTIGRVIRVVDPPEALVCDSHVTVVRCLHVNAEYVRTWLRSDHVYGSIEGRAAGSTNQVELTAQMAAGQVVPLPPLDEQRRIVAKVDELMALCDRLEVARGEREDRRDRLVAASLIRLGSPPDEDDAEANRAHVDFTLGNLPRLATRPEHIKQLRRAILELAVRGRLTSQNAKDGSAPEFDVPDDTAGSDRLDMVLPIGWRWARVKDVASARLGKMLDKAKNSGNEFAYLANTNVHWFNIKSDNLKILKLENAETEKYMLQIGDVLVCEGGHGICRSAVWRGVRKEVAFQKALHRVRPNEYLSGDFFSFCMFIYFQNGVLQRQFTGVGIPHFTGKALETPVFPLPPLTEQRRIVAKVDELMALCDGLEASLTSAASASRGLLEAVLRDALSPVLDEAA